MGVYFKFNLSSKVWDFIYKFNSLGKWGPWNKSPENPSFYTNDTPIIESISHEGMVTITFSDDELKLFLKNDFTLDDVIETE